MPFSPCQSRTPEQNHTVESFRSHTIFDFHPLITHHPCSQTTSVTPLLTTLPFEPLLLCPEPPWEQWQRFLLHCNALLSSATNPVFHVSSKLKIKADVYFLGTVGRGLKRVSCGWKSHHQKGCCQPWALESPVSTPVKLTH